MRQPPRCPHLRATSALSVCVPTAPSGAVAPSGRVPLPLGALPAPRPSGVARCPVVPKHSPRGSSHGRQRTGTKRNEGLRLRSIRPLRSALRCHFPVTDPLSSRAGVDPQGHRIPDGTSVPDMNLPAGFPPTFEQADLRANSYSLYNRNPHRPNAVPEKNSVTAFEQVSVRKLV